MQLVDEGWDFEVAVVNAEWIVRAPRGAEAEVALEKELALLRELAPVLPAAVPRPARVLRKSRLAVVYAALHGQRLDDSLAAGADSTALGQELGRFLVVLHRIPAERALALGVPVEDERDACRAGAGVRRHRRALLERARGWFFLGPWHEVLYGLGPGSAADVASGLAGIRERLPAAPS